MANGFRCAVETAGAVFVAIGMWAFLLPVLILLAVKYTLARYSTRHV